MQLRKTLAAACACLMWCPAVALAHDDDEGKGQLGTVAFENSCDAKVQALFIRGVAMLHSFWYSAAEKTFRDVLA